MKEEQNDVNEPENSRIFVLYDKNHPISENEFKDLFGTYGTVKNIYIVKDRNSDSVKGKKVTYFKFYKFLVCIKCSCFVNNLLWLFFTIIMYDV